MFSGGLFVVSGKMGTHIGHVTSIRYVNDRVWIELWSFLALPLLEVCKTPSVSMDLTFKGAGLILFHLGI